MKLRRASAPSQEELARGDRRGQELQRNEAAEHRDGRLVEREVRVARARQKRAHHGLEELLRGEDSVCVEQHDAVDEREVDLGQVETLARLLRLRLRGRGGEHVVDGGRRDAHLCELPAGRDELRADRLNEGHGGLLRASE